MRPHRCIRDDRGRDEEIQPEFRLIGFLEDDSYLRDEFRMRPSLARGAVIRCDRSARIEELATDSTTLERGRQLSDEVDDAHGKLKRPLL